MRLVDADALKAKSFGKRGGLIHTSDIDAMQTVDAVPVVRCAVCRYFRCNMRGDGILPNGVCVLGRGGYDPMDFCSEGERKDGEYDRG